MVVGVRMETYFVSNSAHGRQPLLEKVAVVQQFLETRSDGAKGLCGGKLLLAGGTNLLNEIVQTVGCGHLRLHPAIAIRLPASHRRAVTRRAITRLRYAQRHRL